MSYRTGFRTFVIFFVFAFAIALSSVLFAGHAEAAETTPVYIGEAIAGANGDAFVLSGTGERLKLNSHPMPIFDGSLIEAKNGAAVISFAPDGLVEVMLGSEVKIERDGKKNVIAINNGAIRFSVPSGDILSITIPSRGITVSLSSKVASTADNIVLDDGLRAGFVELKADGDTIIASSKGSFEVSTVEGDTLVLAEGKAVMMAKAGKGKKGKKTSSRIKAMANATKTHDLIMLGVTAGLATGVAIISQNTDSGGGWVASSP